MKSKLSAALVAASCVLCLSVGAAKADVVNFEVLGSYTGVAPISDGTFSGTLSIDVTTGHVLTAEIQMLGHDLTFIGQSSDAQGGWRIDVEDLTTDLGLVFTVTTNPHSFPHSLVGFAGGNIVGCCFVEETGNPPPSPSLQIVFPAPLHLSPAPSSALACPV